MNGKFSFDPRKILGKTLLFDATKIDKEIIMDMIICALPANNDRKKKKKMTIFILNILLAQTQKEKMEDGQ